MKRALALLLLCLAAPACMAQAAIHHCVSADGSPIFTDQPCDSAASQAIGAMVPGMHRSCSATRKGLTRRVVAAFSDRNANALAGQMLWDGYSDAEALREIARLQRAMHRPLLGIVDATGPPAPASAPGPPPAPAASAPPPDLGALIVHLGGVAPAPGPPLRFPIMARAGCLWLHP